MHAAGGSEQHRGVWTCAHERRRRGLPQAEVFGACDAPQIGQEGECDEGSETTGGRSKGHAVNRSHTEGHVSDYIT